MKKCILFLLFFGTAFAQNNPYNYYQPTEKFFWAEGLYFKAATSDFDYVLVESEISKKKDSDFFAPIGTEQGCCPDYEWGFRIGAQTSLGCDQGDVRLVYSRLCSSNDECTKANCDEGLWLTSGLAPLEANTDILVSTDHITALAENHYKTRWNALDLTLGFQSKKTGCLSVKANGGLHWTNICVDKKLFYQGNRFRSESPNTDYCGNFDSNISVWGIGPHICFDGIYTLGSCWSLEASAGWGILAGGTHRTVKGKVGTFNTMTDTLDDEGKMKVHTPNRCLIFPEFDMALGVYFHAFHNSCVDATIGLGWEFRTYLNAIKQPYYCESSREGLHAINSDSFSLQGLTIRGLLTF